MFLLLPNQGVDRQRLSAAMRDELILRADGNGKFLHDRIQQAAYALIPEVERATTACLHSDGVLNLGSGGER